MAQYTHLRRVLYEKLSRKKLLAEAEAHRLALKLINERLRYAPGCQWSNVDRDTYARCWRILDQLREVELLFQRTTELPTGCWVVPGRPQNKYHRLRKVYAHRVVFEAIHGEIPSGMFVCHACDTPGCINPDHLWLGTAKENHDDAVRKGRKGMGNYRVPNASSADADISFG